MWAFCGFSTDIIKAFNGFPRVPLLSVAGQRGILRTVTRAWGSFIAQLQRRFMISGSVSCQVESCSGFPAGCPLSPVAICLANVLHHHYVSAFLPELRSLSFVDNLATGHEGLPCVRGLQATETFCDMLTLELDRSKTYAWSTAGSLEDCSPLRLGWAIKRWLVVVKPWRLSFNVWVGLRVRRSSNWLRCP